MCCHLKHFGKGCAQNTLHFPIGSVSECDPNNLRRRPSRFTKSTKSRSLVKTSVPACRAAWKIAGSFAGTNPSSRTWIAVTAKHSHNHSPRAGDSCASIQTVTSQQARDDSTHATRTQGPQECLPASGREVPPKPGWESNPLPADPARQSRGPASRECRDAPRIARGLRLCGI